MIFCVGLCVPKLHTKDPNTLCPIQTNMAAEGCHTKSIGRLYQLSCLLLSGKPSMVKGIGCNVSPMAMFVASLAVPGPRKYVK